MVLHDNFISDVRRQISKARVQKCANETNPRKDEIEGLKFDRGVATNIYEECGAHPKNKEDETVISAHVLFTK